MTSLKMVGAHIEDLQNCSTLEKSLHIHGRSRKKIGMMPAFYMYKRYCQ